MHSTFSVALLFWFLSAPTSALAVGAFIQGSSEDGHSRARGQEPTPDAGKVKVIDELLELLLEEQNLRNGPLTAEDAGRDRYRSERIRELMVQGRATDGAKP